MCGICGKLTMREEIPAAALIEGMCRTIVHRGPDDQGVHVAPHIGLGQRRLSIIDLSRSACAPLANEDNTVWIVFNGEIYDFHHLRDELILKGHSFRTSSDTEIIIHLYEEYGVDCLARLRGMFAFAIWDGPRKILFAARDRFGKKPFFYARTGGSLVFGSEIKALHADPEVAVVPDFHAIDRFLTYQYVPSPLTAFQGVLKLPPAHYLLCGVDGSMSVRRYWSPPLVAAENKAQASEEEIAAALLEHLRQAVRMRMVADVPLGVFLSGGIDSATVVALMAEASHRPVKTFSIGTEDDACNELPEARLVAERYGTDHHEFIVKPSALDVLPLLVRHYNEPFADPSAIPTYYVAKAAREFVTVALSGDGGDENFSGYDRYGEIMRWARCDSFLGPVRKALGLSRRVLDLLPYHPVLARLSRGLHMTASALPERYWLQMTSVKPQEKRAAYTAEFRRRLAALPAPVDPVASYPWNGDMDSLDWMMRHDQSFYLPDCLMVKTDIASMIVSLEVRSPLLDHVLAEYAATIPSTLKRDGMVGKIILKKLAGRLLPKELMSRPKTGFGVPLAKWFRGELKDLLRGVLLDDRAARRGLLHAPFVTRMVEDQISGRRDWSTRLWAFLLLELWFREFID